MSANNEKNTKEEEDTSVYPQHTPWYTKDRNIIAFKYAYQHFKLFCNEVITEEKWKPYKAEIFVIPSFTFGFVSLWSLLRSSMYFKKLFIVKKIFRKRTYKSKNNIS